MDTRTSPETYEFVGVTSVVVRNHRGDVTVSHDPDRVDDHGAPAAVRLTPRSAVDLSDAVVTMEDGALVVDVPRLGSGDDGGRGGFRLGPVSFGGGGGAPVHVQVDVPAGVPVDARTKVGDLRLRGTSGDATVTTGAGEIWVERCLALTASSGAGEVRIGSCTGGSATSGTGDVTVESTEGALATRTGAGTLRVQASSGGEVSAASGAGDIHVGLLSGSCQARSGAGDVTVLVPRGEPVWLDLNAGLGNVRNDVDPVGAPTEGQPHLSVHARTGLGDITVRHP